MNVNALTAEGHLKNYQKSAKFEISWSFFWRTGNIFLFYSSVWKYIFTIVKGVFLFAMVHIAEMVMPVKQMNPLVISLVPLELFPVLFQENLKWCKNAFSGRSSSCSAYMETLTVSWPFSLWLFEELSSLLSFLVWVTGIKSNSDKDTLCVTLCVSQYSASNTGLESSSSSEGGKDAQLTNRNTRLFLKQHCTWMSKNTCLLNKTVV